MIVYQQLFDAWAARTNPSAVAVRMVRAALNHVAAALNNGGLNHIKVLPQEQALVLLDAATAKSGLRPQSRCNHRTSLRRLYRFAAEEGIDIAAGNDGNMWPPVPANDNVSRRAQVAYERFVKWAIGCGTWPAIVRTQDLVNWASDERRRANLHWRKDYERLQVAWTALAATDGLRPLVFEPLPARLNEKFAVPVDRWPAHLRDQWQRMARDASAPLRQGGMRPWREITRANYETRLMQLLGWFVANHPAADLNQETWATLLSPARCQAYINWLAVRAGKETLNPGHTAILRSIRGLHRFLLGSDDATVAAFNDLTRRCEVAERDKATRMVPYPLLEAALAKLLAACADGRKVAASKQSSPDRLATLQVNTILWGLLVCRALRQKNIRQLRTGNNLVETDDGYELRFEAREMKGHKAFTTTCPPELVPVIRDYLRRGYRTLAGRDPRDGDVLLLTGAGTPFGSQVVRHRVLRLSMKLVGKPLHPHIFRHIAATYLAQVRKLTPTELAAFLAHRNPLTLMKFYEVTDPTRAAARVDDCRRQAGGTA